MGEAVGERGFGIFKDLQATSYKPSEQSQRETNALVKPGLRQKIENWKRNRALKKEDAKRSAGPVHPDLDRLPTPTEHTDPPKDAFSLKRVLSLKNLLNKILTPRVLKRIDNYPEKNMKPSP